ncbi:MAG: zinc ribbon domain-containing protein [Ilumatobacteraceae bacterium]
MECHACGRSVEADDRFCNGCGASLHGVTNSTQLVDAVVDDESNDRDESSDRDESDDAGAASTSAPGPEHTELIPAIVEEPHPDRGEQASSPIEEQRTELIPVTDDEEWEDEPAWARTGQLTETLAAGDQPSVQPRATELLATEPISDTWMESVPSDIDPPIATPYDFAEREPVAITGQIDAQPAMTQQMPTLVAPAHAEPRTGFRFGLTLFISIIAAVIALGALFANIVVITSDVALIATPDTPDTFRTGAWIADDLAGNISIAGLVAVVLLVMGGVAAGFGWRWGSGLAGGAGLAMAGIAALTLGLAQFPIDVAHQFARIPPAGDPFVLTVTRDLGYWLLLVAGALGVVLFFSSIDDAVGDRRAGLNPWIAALGALAIVVAVAGPLIPENQALFSDNWYLVDSPGEPSAYLLVGRLVQLGLLLLGGVIGFLSVRRWGLGVAVGASLPAVWLTLSTLLDLTDSPVGPGFRNPGANDMHVHGVTIIGMSAVVAMLILGAVGAYDQGNRNHR